MDPGLFVDASKMLALCDALMANIAKAEGCDCLVWTGPRLPGGYGYLSLEGRLYAHRAMWECHHGPIPEGLHVLHKCDTPACCNIEHLFLGTHQDNIRDSVAKGRHGYRGWAPQPKPDPDPSFKRRI